MALTHQDVLEILRAVDGSGCQELILELGDSRLVIRKRAPENPSGVIPPVAAHHAGELQVSAGTSPVLSSPVPGTDTPTTASAAVANSEQDIHHGLVAVRAPMVGRFYRAPSLGAALFVDVGNVTEPKATIGIIEVMKLMNQIPAGVRGRVVAIPAEDGQMVEYGQPLVLIEPVTDPISQQPPCEAVGGVQE